MAPVKVEIVAQPFDPLAFGDILAADLAAPGWTSFKAAFAFLKTSGLAHIAAPLDSFLARSGTDARIAIGIDLGGTSLEGLQGLWRAMNGRGKLYVLHEGGPPATQRSFHPKGYVFGGAGRAAAVISSGNLTGGGLYSNHELGVRLEFNLTDAADLALFRRIEAALAAWQTAGPACMEVTAKLLQDLYDQGDLPSETTINAGQRAARALARARAPATTRKVSFGASGATKRPPTPPTMPANLPAPAVVPVAGPQPTVTVTPPTQQPAAVSAATGTPTSPTATGRRKTFLAEVRPHHNGEILLSMVAINQDPAFFGFPFTGRTVPKRAGNPSYPMAAPDPQVQVVIYDGAGNVISRFDHSLNIVHYERKGEIRITLPMAYIGQIPQMALLAMTEKPSAKYDYRLEFFPSGSTSSRASRLAKGLTMTLSSGGSGRGRRIGWL